jgi:hypothetical protein
MLVTRDVQVNLSIPIVGAAFAVDIQAARHSDSPAGTCQVYAAGTRHVAAPYPPTVKDR